MASGWESPRLAKAGGLYMALSLVEVEHAVVPGQAAVLQQAPAPALLILHELLVGHVQHPPRQQRVPVRHDVVMVLDGARNLCMQCTVLILASSACMRHSNGLLKPSWSSTSCS